MNNTVVRILGILFIVIFSVSQYSAQERNQFLHLQSGRFELANIESSKEFDKEVKSWTDFNGRSYGIVTLMKYPNQEEWKLLAEEGIHYLEFLPKKSFSLSISNSANLDALNQFGILGASSYKPEYKIGISAENVPLRAMAQEGKVAINLHPFADIDLKSLSGNLSSDMRILEVRETSHYILVEVSIDALESISSLPWVKYIDWKYDYGVPENYTGRTLHRVNYLAPEASTGIGYNGEGINVGLQDDGSIGEHIDHEGRILEQFWAGSTGDHGDHVGGTINGAGNLNPLHEGQAKGSNLYVYKAAPQYQGFDSIASHYYSKDVLITSTSYSNGCNAGYTALTRTMDEQVFDMESLVHVFSAGNSGQSNCGYGAGNTWGNITGGHKMGKNVITVANLTENDVLATSSSRGPASDGRIKPDISAKGSSVTSTQEDNTYGVKSGTSMSCPGVSGTLAVLYSAFDDTQGELPPSGLMKAIVLNTADDLGNKGPDFKHGWGRINARKAYEVISNSSFTSGDIANGDSTQFTLIVPPNSASARFMLYWTDPEASTSASTALVNDLDLTIIDPSNNTNLPYLLDHTASTTALNTPATNGADHLNNLEQVAFDNPSPGNYLVKIKGYDIPNGPQEFFLVYWFEPNETVLTYPVGGESMVPNSTEKIRWDIPTDSGTAVIEYTPNGGTTWYTVASGISVASGYHNWSVPNIATGNVMVRMIYGSDTSTSEHFSIIRTPTNLQVEFACPDSIGLTWNDALNATGYQVFKLGSKYMDSIGVSSTSEFVDYSSNPYSTKLWYSVASTGANNAFGKRMVAVKKQPGLVNCILADDAGIEDISPNSKTFYACHGEDEIEVSFDVKNYGANTIASITATFSTVSGQSSSETFVASIAPNATGSFTFTDLIDVMGNSDVVEVVVSAAGDGNSYNDTMNVYYNYVDPQNGEPIWSEDFESFVQCGVESDCGATTCQMYNGWTNEDNVHVDGSDWRTNSGSTPSQFTGPTTDHTTGTTVGKYLYVEASGGCTQTQAYLISPCIDLIESIEPELTFWYSMNGADMGSLHIDVFDGNLWSNDVHIISGNQGSSWDLAEVSLQPFVGNLVNIRFRAITGTDYRSDIAIDDILIAHPPVANFSYGVQLDGITVDFVDSSLYADAMSFDLGEGTVMSSVPSTFTYPTQQVYSVIQIVTNPVGSDTLLKLITTLGDDEVSTPEITMAPNPAVNEVLVRLTEPISTYRVYASSGELILNEQNDKSKSIRLDVSAFSPGIYILELDSKKSLRFSIIR